MPEPAMPPKKPATIDPIRPTDEPARELARRLITQARSASLATLAPDGHPFVSLASLALDADGTPLILVSQLSAHTAHLLAEPRASLLIATSGKGDPLAHPRITLVVVAEPLPRGSHAHERCRALFLAQQPKAALYIDFGDFMLVRLVVQRASLNGGFGRAYELEPADVTGAPQA